ncbi:hypothetical protein [Mycolicibacterium doricum]|jgi:hypothetical protein|nr:hypothetical protein [Mycolicibacterium doricum]
MPPLEATRREEVEVGRRNSYAVSPKGRLRHPLDSSQTVGELIDAPS